MKHMQLFTLIMCGLWYITSANPLPTDPYKMPAITEVQIISMSEWHIELDGEWCLFDSSSNSFPCSAFVYLRIVPFGSTARSFFKAKVGFAKNRYGVLSQSSLIGIQPGRVIALDSRDTVMIARDTLKGSKLVVQAGGEIKYWAFPLRPVSNGKVLVAIESNYPKPPLIFETSRKSLGSEGNYNTNYFITVTDKYGTPLDVSCNGGQMVTTGTFKVTTSLLSPKREFNIGDGRELILREDTSAIPPRTFQYNDKDSLVYDTVRLDITQYDLRIEYSDHQAPFNIGCNTFYHLHNDTGDVIKYRKYLPRPGSNSWLFRVYKSFAVDTVCIRFQLSSSVYDCIDTWVGTYIDTPGIIYDTIVIDPATATKNEMINSSNPDVNYSVLAGKNSELYIITSSRILNTKGIFTMYDLSGKVVATIPVDIRSLGTTTVTLNLAKRKPAAGAYLCKLDIDGYTPLLRNIVIR